MIEREHIEQRRKALGLSRQDVADATGLTVQAIHKLETKLDRVVLDETLAKVSNVLERAEAASRPLGTDASSRIARLETVVADLASAVAELRAQVVERYGETPPAPAERQPPGGFSSLQPQPSGRRPSPPKR